MATNIKIELSENLEMKRREDRFQENDQNDLNNYQDYRGSIKKVKRYRSAFTTEQVNYLEKEFQKHPYIGNLRRKDVANVINIPERAVKIWFQNRRMKEKKDAITKETKDRQNQLVSNSIDELLSKSASTNDPSLPLLSANDVKQGDNEVPSNLRIKRPSPVFTSTDKDKPIMDIFKLNYSMANMSTESSTENSPDISLLSCNKNVSNVKTKTETYSTQVLQAPPHKMSNIFKDHSHFISSPSDTNLPQDLSTIATNTKCDRLNYKHVQDLNKQRNVQASIANMNIPVYLKGYYAQPYIPPGNMIWKPINVAPIMSTGLPAVTTANSSLQQWNMPSRSCNCNCHFKQYSNPMVFPQISPNPPVQYVITAVPFQNQTT